MREEIKITCCPSDEQETIISYSRVDDFADICTSDTTQKTRFNKLCNSNPEHWVKTKEDDWFSYYRCTPKSLISTRSKVTKRTLSDEDRKILAERLAKSRQK